MADFLDQMRILPARKGPLPRMTPANPQEQLEQFPPDWTLIAFSDAQIERVWEKLQLI